MLVWGIGALFIRKRKAMRLARNLGTLLLAIWLVLGGISSLLHFSFAVMGTVMAILAVSAGVLLIAGR